MSFIKSDSAQSDGRGTLYLGIVIAIVAIVGLGLWVTGIWDLISLTISQAYIQFQSTPSISIPTPTPTLNSTPPPSPIP